MKRIVRSKRAGGAAGRRRTLSVNAHQGKEEKKKKKKRKTEFSAPPAHKIKSRAKQKTSNGNLSRGRIHDQSIREPQS